MKLTAWGRFPVIEATAVPLREVLPGPLRRGPLIAYGNGRSYGDSALAPRIVPMLRCNRLLEFDPATGRLRCEAGVLLAEILELFVPRGWFLKVTPGTKLITVGGAIASDVHGKNHHVAGCFSECVESLRLLLADGSQVVCSRRQHADLFHATCGGMGLTGIILEATFFLQSIPSARIDQITIKNDGLDATLAAFETYRESPYSVAWIDCLARGARMGRSLLMVGDFAAAGGDYRPARRLSVPCDCPSFLLNRFSVRAFNQLYYGRIKTPVERRQVAIDSFFYPLDAIDRWNRIYGRGGFTQYQFILPKAAGATGLREILGRIAASGKGSFLAVLKLYGPANANYLSFPLEGYSLALDFKIEPDLFPLLDRLDEVVLACGGRIYLTKDVRVGRETFARGYPDLERFLQVREAYRLKDVFQSLQAQRLGL